MQWFDTILILKLLKSTISLNVLDVNCIKAEAELQNDEDETSGVFTYETFLFARTPEKSCGLSLISFTPEQLIFGCKIEHNVEKHAGEKDTEKNYPADPQGNELKININWPRESQVEAQVQVRSPNILIF